jgi:hypothetical protein
VKRAENKFPGFSPSANVLFGVRSAHRRKVSDTVALAPTNATAADPAFHWRGAANNYLLSQIRRLNRRAKAAMIA